MPHIFIISNITQNATFKIIPKVNYELFNRNSFSIHSWSWNYRGCWHQTCPPIVTRALFCVALIPIVNHCVAAIGICRHYLAVSAPSNLRACCLPWKW